MQSQNRIQQHISQTIIDEEDHFILLASRMRRATCVDGADGEGA